MPAAAIVTIIAVVVVVLVLAAFLLAIARILVDISKKLEAVNATVGTIASQTEPVNSVVHSLRGNLGTARDVLTSLLESKVGADGAADLIASVDPLADAPAAEHTPINHVRSGWDPGDEPVRDLGVEPAPAEPEFEPYEPRPAPAEPEFEPYEPRLEPDEPELGDEERPRFSHRRARDA